MAKSKLVELLYATWKDTDRAIRNLTPEDAGEMHNGGSSFAWTHAHMENQVDSWINVRLGRLEPHTLIGEDRFRFGGSGDADEWETLSRRLSKRCGRRLEIVLTDFLVMVST